MSQNLQEYLNTWLQKVGETLSQIAGEKYQTAIATAEASNTYFDRWSEKGLWFRFTLAKRLQGQHAFLISTDDGIRLAQLFLGETSSDNSDELTPDYRDALEEMFRQFAGVAATALKKDGQETAVQWEGAGRPAWLPADRSCLRLSSPSGPMVLGVAIDPALKTKLETAAGAPAGESNAALSGASAGAAGGLAHGGPSHAAPAYLAQAEGMTRESSRNLDLLMDVQLQVTLRFGQQQLLLKDVLDLTPGSVVELDRLVKDPAELLVTGRVVARGEVVIVDGNYGLRVTEVAPPVQRVEALL